jgi:hypothetical protein
MDGPNVEEVDRIPTFDLNRKLTIRKERAPLSESSISVQGRGSSDGLEAVLC